MKIGGEIERRVKSCKSAKGAVLGICIGLCRTLDKTAGEKEIKSNKGHKVMWAQKSQELEMPHCIFSLKIYRPFAKLHECVDWTQRILAYSSVSKKL